MIEFKNVSFNYQSEVLKNVNIKINSNKHYSIIGSNGCGKTTLLKLIVGILKPTKGEIIFSDCSFSDCGLVFQNPEDQFVSDTVVGDLIFGMENKQFSVDKMSKNIKKYSEIMGVNDYLNDKINTLSGGQKQRVAICSILCMEQKIILLDEASSMLDPVSKEKFISFIKEIKKDYTIISISHDIEETLISDEIIKIEGSSAFIVSKEIAYENQCPFLFEIMKETGKKFESYQELLEEYEIRN